MRNLRLALPLFGLAMLAFQSCQKDEIDNPVNEKKSVRTLQATVGNDEMSRAQIVIGNDATIIRKTKCSRVFERNVRGVKRNVT